MIVAATRHIPIKIGHFALALSWLLMESDIRLVLLLKLEDPVLDQGKDSNEQEQHYRERRA